MVEIYIEGTYKCKEVKNLEFLHSETTTNNFDTLLLDFCVPFCVFSNVVVWFTVGQTPCSALNRNYDIE